MDKYTSVNDLHKLRRVFTSNLYFAYLLVQKMIMFEIKEDFIECEDKRQEESRRKFRNVVEELCNRQKQQSIDDSKAVKFNNQGRKFSLLNFESILEENGDEFADVKDHLVKDYANFFEAYMAAIFLDVGNLVQV